MQVSQRLLDDAKGNLLRSVIIIGVKPNGQMYFSVGVASKMEALNMIRAALQRIKMSGARKGG